MYHILMSGQENTEIEPIRNLKDIFGNDVALGVAQNLDETSIYIWSSVSPLPIMFDSRRIDEVIDELIDSKITAIENKKDYLNQEEDMFVSDCCNKIVYGVPLNSGCIYCNKADRNDSYGG